MLLNTLNMMNWNEAYNNKLLVWRTYCMFCTWFMVWSFVIFKWKQHRGSRDNANDQSHMRHVAARQRISCPRVTMKVKMQGVCATIRGNMCEIIPQNVIDCSKEVVRESAEFTHKPGAKEKGVVRVNDKSV